MSNINEDFMREAIKLSIKNVDENGGPFGALIVKVGAIIVTVVNRVTSINYQTAHVAVNAIR